MAKTTRPYSFGCFGSSSCIAIPKKVTNKEALAFKHYKENQILEEYINRFGGKMEDKIYKWECEKCGKKSVKIISRTSLIIPDDFFSSDAKY